MAAVLRRWPWYLQVALLYLGIRAFSYCVFLAVARQQGPSPWGNGEPGYLQFINIWDAEWYERIFNFGYPAEIPRTDSGNAVTNAWAFYPLFPLLVRPLSAVTGLPWMYAAPLVATLAGLAAALVIYKLFLLVSVRAAGSLPDRTDTAATRALWGVAFVAAFPISPILQVPYAESLHLLLLAGAFYLLLNHAYLPAIPLVLLMDLTRPAGLPFAVLLLVHLVLRFRSRKEDPFGYGERLRALALAGAGAVGAVAWPLLAWWRTGELSAYTDTETAWRGHDLVLFRPWFTTGQELFGNVYGLLAPVLLLAAVYLYVDSAPVRKLGAELRVWVWAYFGYLLAFLDPQTSTFRLLLPLFPLALAAVFVSSSRAYRAAMLGLCLLLQLVWVAWLWEWQQLPGGGDYPP